MKILDAINDAAEPYIYSYKNTSFQANSFRNPALLQVERYLQNEKQITKQKINKQEGNRDTKKVKT